MIVTLLIAAAVVIALGLALFVAVYAWAALAFEELPLFSEGEEPRTVRVLPMPYDQDHEPC